MGDMGLKLAPVLERRPLGPLGLSGAMAGTSLIHSYSRQS